jgi:hypothetical protein
MVAVTDTERELLDRLAVAGKATRLTLSELEVAKSFEADGLIFMIGNTLDAVMAELTKVISRREAELVGSQKRGQCITRHA